MKLSIAVTSIAALAFPHKVAAHRVCNPSLPCGLSGSVEPFSCPCATGTSVPSIGKSGKSSSLSGICGVAIDGNDQSLCCGTGDYSSCWLMLTGYAMDAFQQAIWPYGCNPAGGNCCGFNIFPSAYFNATYFPPCASSSVNGKSGKSTSLSSPTMTCGNANGASGPNPPCCGFDNYPPCESIGQQPCGFLFYPPCGVGTTGYTVAGAINPLAGFQGHSHAHDDHTSTSTLSMEQLSAEVEGAVEEAVEQMVNIGELNVYESSVNVYKYGDDGEGDVVNVVASEGLN